MGCPEQREEEAGYFCVCAWNYSGIYARSIAAGCWHSLAVGMDGNVYVWGDNNNGELGTGDTVDR